MATWHDNKPLLHPNGSIELHMFSMKNSLSQLCITIIKIHCKKTENDSFRSQYCLNKYNIISRGILLMALTL